MTAKRREPHEEPASKKESAFAALVRLTRTYRVVQDATTGETFFVPPGADSVPIPKDRFPSALVRAYEGETERLPSSLKPANDAIKVVLDGLEDIPVEVIVVPVEIPEGLEINAETLVDDIIRFVRTYVLMSDDEALVYALWLIHTHAVEAADFTPYMVISSATKGCGKTTLSVKIPRLLTPNPKASANISGAALFRILAQRITMLLDESDGIWKGSDERAEFIRSVLNAGFSRSEGTVMRCVGDSHEVEEFPCFGPKTVAGIGRLIPETVADRGLGIRLKKAKRGQVKKLRERHPPEEAGPLFLRSAAWASENLDALAQARPPLPDVLDGRGEDICEPVIAIADLLGCGERAREAVVALRTGESADTEAGLALLWDIHAIKQSMPMNDKGLSSADLLDSLIAIEASKWGAWWGDERDRRKGQMKLAAMLREFDIKHTKQRWPGASKPLQGYEWEAFAPAWDAYPPPSLPADGSERLERWNNPDEYGDSGDSEVGTNLELFQPGNGRNPASLGRCSNVPTSNTPQPEGRGVQDDDDDDEAVARALR